MTSKYKEIQHLIDDNENMTEFVDDWKTELDDYLEYYKYRIYVPVFSQITKMDSLHCYYYDKLKVHYNKVKVALGMTIVET